MILHCRVDDKVDTAILGYAPGLGGKPLALVAWPLAKGYGLIAVDLGRIRLSKLPDKLRRRLRRQANLTTSPKLAAYDLQVMVEDVHPYRTSHA